MSDIVLAVKPRWLDLILEKKKTVEARRVLPKDIKPGDKVFLYCQGAILGVAHVYRILRTSEDCLKYGLTSLMMDWCGSNCPASKTMRELEEYMSGARESCCGYIVFSKVARYDDPHPWRGATPKNFIYYR